MPFHTYRCKPCGAEFETLVRGSDIPECPKCASKELDRQIGTIAPDAKIPGLLSAGRSAAAKAGHLSNYSRAERSRK